MIIEIRKAGFLNKGAELMLLAVIQQLRNRYPNAKLTMAPIFGGSPDTYEKMSALRLFPKAWLWRYGFNFGVPLKLIPRKLLDLHGLVMDHEVDVVIDAAGFSYSDQWGVRSSRELADSSSKWKKRGTKLILLPQALGPYNSDSIANYVRKWANNADLIFPREDDSYTYLTDLVGVQDKIRVCPDFTNLIDGTIPSGYLPDDKRVAIVPNYRMVDKTTKEESDAYIPFMSRCARYLVDVGAKPFVLVHEGESDRLLAEVISAAAGGIPIVRETNPLHIKGIIGTCDASIGSRFHGLVSALAQGVPSLATGWSHKYKRLFEDYGFGEGVISVLDNDECAQRKIDMILSTGSAQLIRHGLNEKSEHLKRRSTDMWCQVFKVIESREPRKF